MATITPLNTTNLLFKAGGISGVSDVFEVTSPVLIIAFGLKPSTKITLEMVDVASRQELEENNDCCVVTSCEEYPAPDELIVLDAQPFCDFEICLNNYIGKVLIPGHYRAKMSNLLSLNTAKVRTQTVSIDIALNIPTCTTCA